MKKTTIIIESDSSTSNNTSNATEEVAAILANLPPRSRITVAVQAFAEVKRLDMIARGYAVASPRGGNRIGE